MRPAGQHSGGRPSRGSARRCAAAAAAAALGALGASLAGALSAGASLAGAPSAGAALAGATAGGSSRAAPAPPMPTSLETAAGAWASVPMGRLHQPLDTFWQLFYLPSGRSRWSNRASSLGTATNGGLLLAASGGGLLVGIGASDRLHYSPLLAAGPNADSFVPEPPVPGSGEDLAAGPGDAALGLVAAAGGTVIEHRGGAGWQQLTTARLLAAAAPGRACRPTRLTAVGFGPGGAPLAGAACSRPGAAGLYADDSDHWRAVPIRLPASLLPDELDVVSLQQAAGGELALLEGRSRRGALAVFGAFSGAGAAAWKRSPVLGLGEGAAIRSVGEAAGGGAFVLAAGSGGRLALAELAGPGSTWRRLTPPPPGTATVAFTSAGALEALVPRSSVLTVWHLDRPAGRWSRAQVLHVHILFGSSG